MTAFTTLPFCTCPSGAASLTLAVITSPSPARNPVEPPSGRIICSLRAPELSATSSIDLIITAISQSPCVLAMPLPGAVDVGERRHFRHQRRLAGHFHHDRLLHLVGDDFPYDFFAPSGCRLCRLCHYLFSVTACPVRARSPRMVLTRAMSLRRPRIFFRLSVWPMLSWNFSLNSWSAS